MKRLLIVIFTFFSMVNIVCAEDSDYIKYNGSKYYLLYSQKSNEHNGYYNQYFKKGEDFDFWTDMIAVQHFPNVYSPIDLAHTFRDYLGQYNCPSSLWIDDNKNTGMLDFILIDSDGKKLPITLEFNIFRYAKSPDCGSISIQYAKKYSVADVEQVNTVKKKFEKFRPKALDEIRNIDIPDVVNKDIGEINLNDLP